MNAPVEAFREFLERNPQIFDTDRVVDHFRSTGHHVVPSPFGPEISSHIVGALETGRPFSVIRIGDGESNILTYGRDPDFRDLDEFSVAATVSKHTIDFRVTEPWQVVLRTMMNGAIASADIVGVCGLWRPGIAGVDDTVERFCQNPRGVSGHWLGIHHMMEMAEKKLLAGKIITSAHLYLGLLQYLDSIVTAARRVVCVTNRETAYRRLVSRYPDCDFGHLDATPSTSADTDTPVFLSEISGRLGNNLSSVLCLVGAGPWSEFYCTWIKERGGVGVDLGSAYDILAGKLSRPMHKTASVKKMLASLDLDLPELSDERD